MKNAYTCEEINGTYTMVYHTKKAAMEYLRNRRQDMKGCDLFTTGSFYIEYEDGSSVMYSEDMIMDETGKVSTSGIFRMAGIVAFEEITENSDTVWNCELACIELDEILEEAEEAAEERNAENTNTTKEDNTMKNIINDNTNANLTKNTFNRYEVCWGKYVPIENPTTEIVNEYKTFSKIFNNHDDASEFWCSLYDDNDIMERDIFTLWFVSDENGETKVGEDEWRVIREEQRVDRNNRKTAEEIGKPYMAGCIEWDDTRTYLFFDTAEERDAKALEMAASKNVAETHIRDYVTTTEEENIMTNTYTTYIAFGIWTDRANHGMTYTTFTARNAANAAEILKDNAFASTLTLSASEFADMLTLDGGDRIINLFETFKDIELTARIDDLFRGYRDRMEHDINERAKFTRELNAA